MKKYKIIVHLVCRFFCIFARIDYQQSSNISEVTIGLTEISKAQNANSINIFASKNSNITNIDDIIKYIHKSSELKTCIFYNFEQYLQNIEENQNGFIETTSLIFAKPFHILNELRNRNLAHRLSLFVFFWNATHLPKRRLNYHFAEPFRVVLIIRPRLDVLRIYYNQAAPNDNGELKLVNWYDANSLGLFIVPLLPSPKDVYRNFEGRVLSIPIIHSPPWHFVKYENYSVMNDGNYENESLPIFHVTGGRDYNLLKLIAKKMNFNVNYVDLSVSERTQGSSIIEADTDNLTFSGQIGKIQRREADLLLGDIGITFERKKAVEFSFFTLVDSGAFVTSSPRKLSEAFALIRPFRKEVWPFLILTVAISGPAFYYIIAIPFWWQDSMFSIRNCLKCCASDRKKKEKKKNRLVVRQNDVFNEVYLKEMRYGIRDVGLLNRKLIDRKRIPKHLFQKCMWFAITLFLKQSCNVPCSGIRAKFLSSMLWLAATYVLADIYSAQLTSQLARPAREPPINTLQRLEMAMLHKGYQLYVERQSSSLSILENSTAIFNRLYKLMKHQSNNGLGNDNGYLVSSVEEGINLIKQGSTKAILGGRETLYFNMKRFGTQNFQLSEKLYTRYSAVAVQTGCPFLESLNEVLMHLFEGGILDKMTNAEYERMIQLNQMNEENLRTSVVENNNHQPQRLVEPKLQPISLRLLQGAFFALAFGYVLAGISLLIEKQLHLPYLRKAKILVKKFRKIVKIKLVVLSKNTRKFLHK